MTNFGTKLSSIVGVVKRSGVVIYVCLLLISLFVAYVSPYEFDSVSLSSKLLVAGIVVLSFLVFLEIFRRVLLFIFFEQPFFQKKIPLVGIVFGVLGIVLLISSPLMLVIYDNPKHASDQSEQEKHSLANYQDAVENLAAAKAAATACYEKAKERISSTPSTESAECRRIRLGYNACREGGYLSHTQCISVWDYESSCSADISFSKDFLLATASSTCAARVQNIESTIYWYESTHSEVVGSKQ